MTSETRRGRGASLVGAMLERRYRVDALIARGGMSTVYRGLDTRLDRPVAIKVMDAQYSGDRSFVDRFEREARAAAKLHHPDIVAVYDQGVDHGTGEEHVFLVMQLVEGCTLRDLIMDRGRLPLAMALSVIEPVLSALEAAHRAEMVHRDVKPENVLIGTDGSVKVADFGLVRAAAEAGTTSGSVILGTVAYLSPEQVTTGAADARTDVYAAGIVLYEMLTGRPPYVGDTALSVAYRHVNDDVPPPVEQVPDLPPVINDLVVRATRRDPAQRPQSAEAFLAEVQQARAELGISPVPVPVPESAESTTLMPTITDDDPPTAQIPVVQDAPPPVQPQRTRAMLRPATGDDYTQEMAPVPAARPAPQRQRGRRTVAMWTAIVLVLAALVGGAAFWLGLGSYVDVPKLVGEQETAAQEALAAADLTGNVTRENDNDVPEGVVISSNPREGSQVRTGSTVDLVVSLGKPKVPEIAEGTPLAEAESLIRNAKLKPKHDESADQFHTTVPEGRVISVDPGPGTPLNISSEVSLIVSKGPPPVPVPDVRGMSRDDAFATLSNAGFEPYELGKEFDGDVAADHVISTDPAIGEEIRLVGRPRIGVLLSNAVTVPSLTGGTVEEAQQKVQELGLTLNVSAIFQREGMRILTQYPFADSRVEPGSEIHVTAF
ncbi:Stk1 family PASTA domain-containing Ser/Thr kinase [Saccharopolyspora indica]|uniref:Stk1 family PASTA domain-containing Ser/Thr kinase n=1 Tax=Saccharopolyspora indica TaxID=1229659 RepID=UPI0022EA13EC|nr:Stk1 family PASTA domain-containing Ser/Thr kinase [Saccharopolyspora indica]MDA3649270.1 Stk1 family PASTA domain-containing Ser/Thr kinase [Saccharopolyspora indica]